MNLGPKAKTTFSCGDCDFFVKELDNSWVNDGTVFKRSCSKCDKSLDSSIGTPDWCPFLDDVKLLHIKTLQPKKE